MSNLSSGKNIKKRNWALVLYPESAPADWLEQLQNTGLQGCISPLHDKDVDPTGEPKKAHYHIILCYSGPTSFSVVNALCVALHQPHPVPLEQIRGYYRYLTHKDNPDKYQYDERDIKSFNGFNISDYCETKCPQAELLFRQVAWFSLSASLKKKHLKYIVEKLEEYKNEF